MRKYLTAMFLLVVFVLMSGCMGPPPRARYVYTRMGHPVYIRPAPPPRHVVVRVHAPPPPRTKVRIRIGR
jgi:hypothetical protein